tara:strand:+ start:322 stop:459 length:138 start_codon:yes stop_codon:yes gene_type:complete
MLSFLASIGEFLIDCICNGREKGIDLDDGNDNINVDDNGEIYGDI